MRWAAHIGVTDSAPHSNHRHTYSPSHTMRNRKAISIPSDARRRAIASIRQYFIDNMDGAISELKAELLLDYILVEHGPAIYNQGIADARQYLEERAADLSAICHYDEYPLSGSARRKPG